MMKSGVGASPAHDMSDKSVKLKVSMPDRSGREEDDRGNVLEEESWDSGKNYIGVEIVQEDSEVSADDKIKLEETLTLKTSKETEN